ncbi:hypothetical protein KAW96_07145 [candidate division WOR-3 bacterium]|nr:hypothetical protein [candidate division WOR-3 bacterium]
MDVLKVTKFRDLKNWIFSVLILLPSFILADFWIQTDWSGEEGYIHWQDSTG